jgi:hypothetical protein
MGDSPFSSCVQQNLAPTISECSRSQMIHSMIHTLLVAKVTLWKSINTAALSLDCHAFHQTTTPSLGHPKLQGYQSLRSRTSQIYHTQASRASGALSPDHTTAPPAPEQQVSSTDTRTMPETPAGSTRGGSGGSQDSRADTLFGSTGVPQPSVASGSTRRGSDWTSAESSETGAARSQGDQSPSEPAVSEAGSAEIVSSSFKSCSCWGARK